MPELCAEPQHSALSWPVLYNTASVQADTQGMVQTIECVMQRTAQSQYGSCWPNDAWSGEADYK